VGHTCDWDRKDQDSRPVQVNSSETPSSKITREIWAGGMAKIVECLLWECETLSSNPSPTIQGVEGWQNGLSVLLSKCETCVQTATKKNSLHQKQPLSLEPPKPWVQIYLLLHKVSLSQVCHYRNKKNWIIYLKKSTLWPGASGSCYSGDRDQEDCGAKPAWENSLWHPVSKEPITNKG
jgi:hypothetical protein